jgi:hypothetical protein
MSTSGLPTEDSIRLMISKEEITATTNVSGPDYEFAVDRCFFSGQS